MMKTRTKILLFFLPGEIFLCIWGVSILKCEIQTLVRGREFEGFEENNGTFRYPKANQLKVLEYTDCSARVLYRRTKNHDYPYSLAFKFARKGNDWEVVTWQVLWADTGNADEIVWPYFR